MLHYFDRLVFHSSFPAQFACPSDPVVLPLPNARVGHETCLFFFCSCWHFMCCWKPTRCFLLSNLNSFDMQHVVCCYRNRRHHIVLPHMIRIGWDFSVNPFLFRFVDVSFLRWPWEYPWRQHMARCVDGFGVDTLWPTEKMEGFMKSPKHHDFYPDFFLSSK